MSTKEEIFDYVMESPENTNPAILRSMLNELSSGSGGGVLNVHINEAEAGYVVRDATAQEIHDAIVADKMILLTFDDNEDQFTVTDRWAYQGSNFALQAIKITTGENNITFNVVYMNALGSDEIHIEWNFYDCETVTN